MPLPDYPSTNRPAFVAASLERTAHWRGDTEKLASLMADAQVIPVCRYRMPIRGDSLQTLPASALADELERAIWLGMWQGRSLYALEVSEQAKAAWPELTFADLRGASMHLQADHAAVMAYARALIFWHQRHQFCGRCGGTTQARESGHLLYCQACDLDHYPRSDPSMLVQVSDEQDRSLLGRQSGWPAGMWSVLAGFVEPGEAIEDCVVREVWEEARIKVTAMRYAASQPWPFPASVLMGFHAHGVGDNPAVEQDELEAAQWFSREDIRQGLQDKTLFLPLPVTLSFHLLAQWYDKRAEAPLRSLLGQRN